MNTANKRGNFFIGRIGAILLFTGLLFPATPCPAGDYAAHGDGTVTDNSTGLMWQQQDDNQQRNWEDALEYCENLVLAGHADWRLPNIREIESITDDTRSNPAIDSAVFPGTKSSRYRSSSTSSNRPDNAWSVNFGNGDVNSNFKSNSYYVRCVRGGE